MVADLRSAVLGSVAWTITALASVSGAVELSLIDLLLALASLAVVPVGLVVAGRPTGRLRLVAAALVVPALLSDTGPAAGAMALPWLAVATHLFVVAAIAWLDRPDLDPAGLARLASPVYLTVGATWLVASRLGLEPVGIGEPIVELTAVHFHYAGFAAALLAARYELAAGPWAAAGTLLTIASLPIVAIGFASGAPLSQMPAPSSSASACGSWPA